MITRLVFAIVRQLSLSSIHRLGAALGWLIWTFSPRQQYLALRNLELCLPELSQQERRRIARASFGHYGKTLAEYPLIWTGDAARVRGLAVKVVGQHLVDDAIAAGKGVVLAALHLGSFEAGIIPLAERHPLTGVYKPTGDKALDAFALQGRMRFGAKMVAIQRRAGSKSRVIGSDLLRALKRGEAIYALPDRDPPRGQGVFVPYFGVNAHSPTLIPKLVRATGARVVICVGERLPDARGFIIQFREPPPGYDSENLDEAVTAINAGLEACVRDYPEQYWWSHRRFMRRPEGEASLYSPQLRWPFMTARVQPGA